MAPSAVLTGAMIAIALAGGPASLVAQDPSPPSQARRMSASWTAAPIRDVLRAFAAYSGTSIVASADVSGVVTADINDQPWDVALRTILQVNGLIATENPSGIIRVGDMGEMNRREAVAPVLTRTYRVSYARASEIRAAIAPLLTDRGSVSVVEATNTLVVSDIARVQRDVASLLR